MSGLHKMYHAQMWNLILHLSGGRRKRESEREASLAIIKSLAPLRGTDGGAVFIGSSIGNTE